MSKTMKYMLTRIVENKLELNARAFKTYGGYGPIRIGYKTLLEVFNFRG
jgi:hypothetical protein